MTFEPADLLIPAIHLVTLLITFTSAVFVYRQKTTEYPQVRNLLVMVHGFYIGIVSLEFVRTFVPTDGCTASGCPPGLTDLFLRVYTVSNTSFVLADVLLLTLVAVAIFYRPNGQRMKDILREVMTHQLGATLLIVYAAYIVLAEGFLLFVPSAFSAQVLPTLVGSTEVATQFDTQYLFTLLGILVLFLVYPSGLLIAARRRTSDAQVRRAFAILPIAWVGIGVDLLIFNGFLLNEGIDASSVGYLFAAAAFAATAATFRRATLLSAFFQPGVSPVPPPVPSATTFSGRLGVVPEAFIGKEYLLEVDSSSNFEEPIRDFANELGSKQFVLFAFTAGGSPVHSALSGLGNVRFFTMTRKVSYPKPGERPDEVLVPSADQSVLLNVLDKAISSNPDLKFGVVFDSVTDLILTSGLEVTYKFLKQANEMINSNRITSVFLMTFGAHNEREVNVVKSLFANVLTYGNGALTSQKKA